MTLNADRISRTHRSAGQRNNTSKISKHVRLAPYQTQNRFLLEAGGPTVAITDRQLDTYDLERIECELDTHIAYSMRGTTVPHSRVPKKALLLQTTTLSTYIIRYDLHMHHIIRRAATNATPQANSYKI